jgi:regulator of nonsense transcripts 2
MCGNPVVLARCAFKVLVKEGHKQQTKQMPIRGYCPTGAEQQSAAELEEKQHMNRKILGYNEREEEEELNGAFARKWERLVSRRKD